MDDVGRLSIFLILLALSFIFSSVLVCLNNINISKLKDDIEEDEERFSSSLKKIVQIPLEKQLQTFNISYIFATVGAVLACKSVVDFYTASFLSTVDLYNTKIGYILITIVLLIIAMVIVLIVGLCIPQRTFCFDSEKKLETMYPIAFVMSRLFYPLSAIINVCATGIVRVFGIKNKSEKGDLSEENIRYLIEASEENGDIEEEEKDMINNIFEFDDKTVDELMTHRTNILGVELNENISDVVYYAINKGFSRIPVYDDTIDTIVGILYVKDLLCLVGCASSTEFKIADFMRKTIFVPEAKKCIDLFNIFKAQKAHMAIVIDAYGGTAGIITMEDLLESIVGNIQDEYDQEKDEITKIDDFTYSLDGAISLDKVEKLLSIDIDREDDTDTLGGYIIDQIGRIPNEDEQPSVFIDNIMFTVILVEDQRISKIKCKITNNTVQEV